MDSFNEFLLLEMTNEIDFIREFFNSFKNFNQYDKQTLGVFADWLQERDDQRLKLVRMAYEAADLKPASMRKTVAIEAGVSTRIRYSPSWKRGEIAYVSFYILLSKPCFIMGKEEESRWTSWGGAKDSISISGIDNEILEEFFWSLIGHGWNYDGDAF